MAKHGLKPFPLVSSIASCFKMLDSFKSLLGERDLICGGDAEKLLHLYT